MDAPDYSKYSIEQLHDAFSHVDRDRYPDRYEAIKAQLDSRTDSVIIEKRVYGSEISKRFNISIDQLQFLNKNLIFVQIASVVLGLSTLAAFLLGDINTGFKPFWIHVSMGSDSAKLEIFFIQYFFFFPLVSLLLGSLSIFMKLRFFIIVMATGWFLLSVQIAIGNFKYMPELASFFGFHLGFSFTFDNSVFSIYVLILPLIAAFWSTIAIPDKKGVAQDLLK